MKCSRFGIRRGFTWLALVFCGFLVLSCGPGSEISQNLSEPGGMIAPPEGGGEGTFLGSSRLILSARTVLYENRSDILEKKVEVPAGATIEIPAPYEIQNIRYRKADGTVDWTSTGFIHPVLVVSIPGRDVTEVEELNRTSGGLYVFASVVGDLHGVEGDFDAIASAPPGADFLTLFEPSGKPKFNSTASIKKRFGERLNKGVDPNTQKPAEREKWRRIHSELIRAANRTVPNPKAILMIDRDLAIERSIAFEEKGIIPLNGAWTIAVQATAVRHGFPNVPCAEFMSELLRQAYQRAGYAVTDDFNLQKKNRLFWSDTAAVVNLSKALDVAGWVPWDTSQYRPITGALMMHAAGFTPGHAYISAGHDGRLIVDNGSPQGRDLRATVAKTINLMYKSGVFFLPPGINPPKW